jgi:ribosomal protein L7/L12
MDIDEKGYALVNNELKNLSTGAGMHSGDVVKPLPSDFTVVAIDAVKNDLALKHQACMDHNTAGDTIYGDYHKALTAAETYKNEKVRVIKGVKGATNIVLKDFGVKPNKPRGKNKPKPPTP